MKLKATGIVRKIDELGRLVIPKEIRTSQNWKEGSPMEIFMSEEGMVIRKFQSQVSDQGAILKELDALLQITTPKAAESIKKAMVYIQQN